MNDDTKVIEDKQPKTGTRSMSRNMAIQVREIRPSDLPARERIFSAAFSAGLRPHIFPNGTTEADLVHSFTDNLSSFKNKTSTSDTQAGQRAFVAYDTDTPAEPSDLVFPDAWEHKAEVELSAEDKEIARRVVGVAIWMFQPFARTQEDIDKEAAEESSRTYPPSANAALLDAFGASLKASREKFIGLKPYLYLKVLAIDPAYQRRGVGSLLLDCGLEIADRCGVQAYLEATKVGRPLYARYGFEDREFLDFDVGSHVPEAREQAHQFMIMVRPVGAKKVDGKV